MPRDPKYEQVPPKWVKSTHHDQNLFNSEGSNNTSAWPISDYYSLAFSRKCLENPDMISFIKLEKALILGKSTDHDQNLTISESGHDTSAFQITSHSFHAFSDKCPETSPDGQTEEQKDRWTDEKGSGLVRQTNGLMYRQKDGLLEFRRMDGWTTLKRNASRQRHNEKFTDN